MPLYLEFCLVPATGGYIIYDWTRWSNKSDYTWEKVAANGTFYYVRTDDDYNNPVVILEHYLRMKHYALVRTIRLD